MPPETRLFLVGGNDFGDRWVIQALHGGPLLDFSVKKGRRWGADRSGSVQDVATGNAVGGLPLTVEAPFEFVCWGGRFVFALKQRSVAGVSVETAMPYAR